MTHRVMSTSPLFYKMIDYSKHQTCFEVAPIFSSMYDSSHVNQNIILNGKNSLFFDQQGGGDINPMWLNLMSNNTLANYKSTVTFTPRFTESGALFHWYDQSDSNVFIDIKTALVQCKSEIKISEIGGDNGLLPGIMNAQQAFTQSDWNYGKIGRSNHVVGLDNVELRLGKVAKCTDDSSSYNMLISGFGIIEAPTGTGSKAEWLFEPQVGTNHWGLGFGFEALVSGDDDLKFMIAGNYRYLIPAWETRSFDLLGNGQWSRYLSVQDTYGLPTAPATLGLPGINYFTQQAYINGRSELNLYTRLQKQFKSSYFELSYNFFCIQQETIGAIKTITPGYGIYALNGPAGGPGGVTTASTATINQDITPFDSIGAPVAVTTDRFDKLSACAAAYATNTLAARVEIRNKNVIYGFGASIEAALSASALSTWSVWAQFGFLFDNIVSSHCDHEFSAELYDVDVTTTDSIHHEMIMDDAGLPQDVLMAMQDHFIDTHDNFEFQDDEDFNFNEEINKLQKNLITSEISQLREEIVYQEEQNNKIIESLKAQLESCLEKKEENIVETPDNADLVENLIATNNDQTSEITPATPIISLENHEIIPQAEFSLELIDDSVATKIPTTPTISLEHHEVMPQNEAGLELIDDSAARESVDKNNQVTLGSTPVENQTIALENTPVAPQTEAGLNLSENIAVQAKEDFALAQDSLITPLVDTLEITHEPAIMTAEQIAQLNPRNNSPMTEKEILDKLDSKK